jgi:WD40 repeat protein
VDDGLLYDADGKQFEEVQVVEVETERGIIYWLSVPDSDPDCNRYNVELYEGGWKGGIYFFGGDGKYISMLEKEDSNSCYVFFSPDGKQFILRAPVDQYLLYEFDGLKLKKSFGGTTLEWIDPFRFAYSIIDESKNAREEAGFDGWLTVVVYDSAADLLTTVIEATATEDFLVDSFDAETGELVIWKKSVEDEKDWGDFFKQKLERIRVPVPAAR